MRQPFPWLQYSFEAETKDLTKRLFHQVHGNEILRLDSAPSPTALLREADGAYTFTPHLALRAFSADCLPLLFFSSKPEGAIAAVHSGWRGAKVGIAARALACLGPSESIWVAVGPSLLGCCFEVKEDFIDEFRQSGPAFLDYLEKREGRFYFHLANFVVKHQLRSLYERNQVIWQDSRCTVCSDPPLPSFRRNKGTDPWICAQIIKTN